MDGLTVKQRAAGAIIGSILADSAALSIHWIYDADKLKSILSGVEKPEFLPVSHCPFYRIPIGKNSCYGDQTFVLLKSMVENKGFNKDAYAKAFYEKFGPSSEYAVNDDRTITKDDLPITGPWRNMSVKTFLKNYSEKTKPTGDQKDYQADGTAKVAPLVAMYAGHPELERIVKEAVGVTQEFDLAVNCAVAGARLLEQFILHGHSPAVALDNIAPTCDPDIKSMIDEVKGARDEPHDEASVKKFGITCALPGNFKSVLHCVLTADPHDYVTTMRKTMTAGGDNCSRILLAGACAGAMVGDKGIPGDWVDKTLVGSEVVTLANKLIDMRE